MTKVEHIANVNEVQCVYASIDDKGNGKSNIEIEKDEDIDIITTEAQDESDKNNFIAEAKDEIVEVIYDEENLSNDDWFKIMQEKKLIDDLMNDKGHLLEIVTDDEFAVAMKTEKVVLDRFHVEAEDNICEANDALAVEKYEKKNVANDILNILMNVSKCADLEKPGEVEEQIHFAKMEMLLDCVDYTDAEPKNKFEDSLWTMSKKRGFSRARFQKEKRRMKPWSREKKRRVKMKLK